jgi:cephalosporin-C deacetylase-like acetyl esterase
MSTRSFRETTERITKLIAEGLNDKVCKDYAVITAYNKVDVYDDMNVFQIVVRLPMDVRDLEAHRRQGRRK